MDESKVLKGLNSDEINLFAHIGMLTQRWNIVEAMFPLIYMALLDVKFSEPYLRFIPNLSIIGLTNEVTKEKINEEPLIRLISHCGDYFDACRVNRNLITHGFLGSGLRSPVNEFNLHKTRDSRRVKTKSYGASQENIANCIIELESCSRLIEICVSLIKKSSLMPHWKSYYPNIDLTSPEELVLGFPLPKKLPESLGSPHKH